jgi:hypothetical protein
MKSDIHRYRAKAERYLVMAARARTPLMAVEYQELAQLWLRMAADADDIERARQVLKQAIDGSKTGP